MINQVKEYLELLQEVDGVRSIVLTGSDGLLIENIDLSTKTDPDVIAAMVAGMFGMMKRSILRIDSGENIIKGDMNQLTLELSDAKIFAVKVNDSFLSVITYGNVNLGLLRLYINKVAEKISGII